MKNAVLVAACAAVTLASLVGAASISLSREDGVSTPELAREFNMWINKFLFSEDVFVWTRETMGDKAAHYFLTYIRNFLGGSMLYYITAACWHW